MARTPTAEKDPSGNPAESGSVGVVRARAPRPPAKSAGLSKAEAEHRTYLAEREGGERRSQLRGLVWLALLALFVSLVRAGLNRSFYAGWWRQW